MNQSPVSVAVVSKDTSHRSLLVEILQKRGFEAIAVLSIADQESSEEPSERSRSEPSLERYFFMEDINQALASSDLVVVDISAGITDELEQIISRTVEVNKPALYLDDYLSENAPALLADIDQRITEKLLSLYAHQQDYVHLPEKTWLLAGSTGGPEAVKEFIERLPEESDYSFLYDYS